jgi:6-phosphogluconolactonase
MTATLVSGDQLEIERALAEHFTASAREAIASRGAFHIALSGGSIGPLLFPALARLPLDWHRIDFFWADERAVPPDHPDSNFAEANRLWLKPAGVPPERIHRMHADAQDLALAAREYSVELSRIAGSPPALDFALLGVGPDGHVASLFPGHAALRVEALAAVAIEDAPKPPPRRMTLTLPVLAGAAQVVIAGKGAEKALVIKSAMTPGSRLPAGMLMSRGRDVRVLLLK